MQYVAYYKVGTLAPPPPGDWSVVAESICVVGVERHLRAVHSFARAVETAERLNFTYGLTLERQPQYRGTTEEIAVHGFAEVKGIFGKRRRSWRLGFVPGAVARKVGPAGTHSSEEVAVRLHAIFSGLGDFWEIRFALMVPHVAMRMAA